MYQLAEAFLSHNETLSQATQWVTAELRSAARLAGRRCCSA
jgi:hypothetical protein